jgi:DNA repair protein RadD
MSPGLLVQMVGRGTRLHPGKHDCLVLDFAQNIARHGPIDTIRVKAQESSSATGEAPAKECPECRALIALAYSICPQCGHEFPPPDRKKHEAHASQAGVLSGQVTAAEYDVRDISYSVHTKKDAGDEAPKTLRVDYRLGLDYWVSEWICFEHSGYARRKAEQWWRIRSSCPVPDTAQEACDIAEAGGIADTLAVTVQSVAGEKFERVVAHHLGPKPAIRAVQSYRELVDVPF